MQSKLSTFRLYVCLSALAMAGSAPAQNITKPEGKPILLEGTIRLVHGYGPPGYGETPKRDTHVTYWAIETNRPVMADPNSGEFDCIPTRRLKLFFSGGELLRVEEMPAAKWKDQSVVVSGKIHCADTAGEMTHIYMDVDKISAFNKR